MKAVVIRTMIAAIGLGVASAAAAADVALVINNFTYDNLSPIKDIRTARRDVIRAYQRDGFEVISGQNVGATDMAELLREFEDRAEDADRLVVHFSGHVATSRQNMRFATRELGKGSFVGVHYAAPSLDLIYELVDHRPGRSAVFVATPENGVATAIANGPHIPQGVLVMSGQPRAFNRYIVNDFFRNDESGKDAAGKSGINVTGYISDVAMTPDVPKAATAPATPTATDTAAEMRAWRAAAQSGSREALEGYIAAYPRGLFKREAEARLAALGPAISPEQRIEDALRLTRAQRRAIQRNLTLLGFDTRGVDGIFGNGSRRAINAWQRAEGFRNTGFLDRAQIRVLEEAAKARQSELDAKAAADRELRDQQDLALWQATGASGEERDLRNYLAKYPDGLFAPQAKRLLATIEADARPRVDEQALARENALNLNGQTRRLVEQRLASLRLNPGPVDGAFDENTRVAIAAFQKDRRLRETGYLDSDTLGQLIVSVFGR